MTVNSEVRHAPQLDRRESDIFERSIESQRQSRHSSFNGTPYVLHTEDYVAPVLDSTAEILTNPDVGYDRVELVCCDYDCGCDRPNSTSCDTSTNTGSTAADTAAAPSASAEAAERDGSASSYLGRSMSAPMVPMYRGRSRSIISTSLMSCIASSSSSTSATSGSGGGEQAFSPQVSFSPPTASRTFSPGSSPSSPHRPVGPQPHRTTPYGSLVRTSCTSAIPSSPSQSMFRPDYVINFYSYADMLSSEHSSRSSSLENTTDTAPEGSPFSFSLRDAAATPVVPQREVSPKSRTSSSNASVRSVLDFQPGDNGNQGALSG
ncbi:Piso0_005465 [Millerozyma farinosa CBS 7064]|uniref:Piso0_005465 protein n=1 Tax=Pichia sorbitophila (strain ATCC MYA-4447 / BCRC 22081 / CBS 7064 / NBRC 10061 / NRRL Y-12695) TaxID=559304 RepID=G8Y562_PICSO|nr:Piso0_005465 [Millerozyma farinosa CBS 7064]